MIKAAQRHIMVSALSMTISEVCAFYTHHEDYVHSFYIYNVEATLHIFGKATLSFTTLHCA